MTSTDKNIKTVVNQSGFISIKDLPSDIELEKFYEKHYFQDEKTRPKSYQLSYDDREKKHIDLVNDLSFHAICTINPNWKKNPGSLLEIGVGEGYSLARAQFYGWSVQGVDFGDHGLQKFNPQIIDKLEKGNIFKILEKYSKENKKFDVCIVKNVLEHVIDPKELLNTLRNLLKKNGILVLTVPNDFSKLQLRALELGLVNEKFWLMPPQHLHYFNSENICSFLEENNFSILDLYSSFPIDFFLYSSGSNYIKNPKSGKSTHKARVELEILMAENNLKNYHRFCQSLALCHVGRNLTILIKPK